MVHRLPITKARINLGQLAKRAHLNNEYFILEKDGIPVIGIMDADELEDYLELRNPKSRHRSGKATWIFALAAPGPPRICFTISRLPLLNRGAVHETDIPTP